MKEEKKKKKVSLSVLQKRIKKFKSIKRGYYSFLIILVLYILSFFFPFLINYKALVVKYEGRIYFPVFQYYAGETFDQDIIGEADYRALKEKFKKDDSGNWVIMPLYPYGPYESLMEKIKGQPPHPPTSQNWFGTDASGRDVFARMAYGFNISLSFALILTFFNYAIGVSIGALLGFYGGVFDIVAQRFIEIWAAIPFLYTVIIISSILRPSFLLLVVIITMFGWIGMTYYMRGEFYREKAKDYVSAAVSMGATDREIMFKHILPNSLTPIISLFPFSIVGGITSLVSLDFLGFGLAPPTPSWGEMFNTGLENIFNWWLIAAPLAAMFFTLLMVVFIGEAIREAFDPKVFSRLR